MEKLSCAAEVPQTVADSKPIMTQTTIMVDAQCVDRSFKEIYYASYGHCIMASTGSCKCCMDHKLIKTMSGMQEIAETS